MMKRRSFLLGLLGAPVAVHTAAALTKSRQEYDWTEVSASVTFTPDHLDYKSIRISHEPLPYWKNAGQTDD